jgi:hypothetical protein
MFTRVLMKYLEQKDPAMHAKAKLIIKDCAERNKRQERGYESVTASMRERLKELVGEQYWKRAESYLKHFLEQRKPGSTSGSSGGGGGASSTTAVGGATSGASSQPQQASASSSQQQQQQQQQLEQEKARKAAATSSASSKSSRPTTATPAAIANLRQEISQKRQALSGSSGPGAAGATASGAAGATASGSTTPKSSNSKSSKKATKRKSGASVTSASPRTSGKSPAIGTTPAAAAASSKESTPAATKPAASTPEVQPGELPPREYKDFMEMVDHAIDYDWTTSGMLLGNADFELSEEQRKLVYDTPPPPKASTSPTRLSTAAAEWGKRNVVSARAGWARVRLREQNPPSRTPVVADGLLKLPTAPGGDTASSSPATPSSAWVNEETAEQDPVLHMLSEGCESYLKGILAKALVCARQRQNLDGIRLWHQQHKTDENSTPPALSLRLGCDVPRQAARAAANAAMTCKRMEQALERQHVPTQNRTLSDETLLQATSMTDLALRPQLSQGVENADYTAKRSLEIYGGKQASSSEPPLGRVPKQAKLEVTDFVMGSNFTSRIRHQAGPASATMFF